MVKVVVAIISLTCVPRVGPWLSCDGVAFRIRASEAVPELSFNFGYYNTFGSLNVVKFHFRV
jgi:hypothetical protein